MVTVEQGEARKSPNKKIKALWYGPFEKLEKVGDNAYRLIYPHTCEFTQLWMKRI